MQQTIAIAGMVAATAGIVPTVLAQAGSAQVGSYSPSPAQMLGVQERSIQQDVKTGRSTPSIDSSTPVEPSSRDDGLVLYRIDRKTRVLVGPVRGTTPISDLPVAQSQIGDNRLQLLYDLEE